MHIKFYICLTPLRQGGRYSWSANTVAIRTTAQRIRTVLLCISTLEPANFTYLDYVTNIDISDDAPELYIKRYKEKLGDEYKIHCDNHALPENFETMDYMEFLSKRRTLMAQIIKKACLRL